MALKSSAAIVIVESERTLPLLLGPTHRPSIFAFSCQLLLCRFQNFSPETLVTSLLRLQLLQIMRYAFITFFLLA
jgi:hypothetical protein